MLFSYYLATFILDQLLFSFFYSHLLVWKCINTIKIKLSLVGCKIRMIPDTPTDLFRTVLPIYSGHPYRFIADSGTELGKTVQNVPLISAKMCHEPRPDFEKIATVMPLSVSVRTVPIISVRIVPYWRAA